MFPLSTRFVMPLADAALPAAALAQRIGARLGSEPVVSEVEVDGPRVRFVVPLILFGANWRPLSQVSSGELVVEDGERGRVLSVELRFERLVGLAALVFVFLWLLATALGVLSGPADLLGIAGMCVVLVVLNQLGARLALRRLARAAAHST